jgi:2-keto-4-pentenoate hydratase/2-oxohepta-3-ene-1,7-dioic acid hydratase in catechol pathway
MRLANCQVAGETHLCSVTGHGVFDLSAAATTEGRLDVPGSVDEALEDWEKSLGILIPIEERILEGRSRPGRPLEPSGLKFLPPVLRPSKILCVFVNYRSHGQEVGTAPSEPVFFFKHQNSLVGDGDEVVVPRFSSKADHEVELGVVIGKRGKNIQPREAYEFVAGYTVLNDISFRDGMRSGVDGTVLGRNLYKGKVADTALPAGPTLVTRDEIPNPYPLKLTLKVNGEVRQAGSTEDMIFKIPDLIATASADNTLLPGDLIATGTCSGVGLYTGKYLRNGDLMEAEVERVGVLRNRVSTQQVAEDPRPHGAGSLDQSSIT